MTHDTVAVVGGGFSGLLTAVHLLRDSARVRVHLIEPHRRVGAGRAYATGNPHHLLNVRVGNMSAFTHDPDHFRRWMGSPTGNAFVTRGAYGDYLQHLLDDELDALGDGGRLTLHRASATGAHPSGDGWRVDLSSGNSIDAQAVVLAVGLLQATAPEGVSAEAQDHPGWVSDPWGGDLSGVPEGDVLLLGTGLTMIDVALSLNSPGRRLTALSRHGLLPRTHGATVPAPVPGLLSRPLSALRRLRRHAEVVGWRTAVDSVRWVTPDIWRAWTVRERRQFLRHLRAWWDVHRHRMAPEVAHSVADMERQGRFRSLAAKVVSAAPAGDGIEVVFRPRGSHDVQTRRFAAVIDCASARGDVARAGGLIGDLRGQGLLRPDPLGLGLDVGPGWAVRGADGRPTPGLYAIGPLTRGAVWESIAVPDLRRHAQDVAGAALGYLSVGADQVPLSAVRGRG